MSLWTNLCRLVSVSGNKSGSVAVETALMTPIVIMILWLLSGLSYTWRMEGAVHRATAALADVLANQRGASNEMFSVSLQNAFPHLGESFVEMVSGERRQDGQIRSKMEYGIGVSYYDSKVGSASDPKDNSVIMQTGLRCNNILETEELSVLGEPGGESSLVTQLNMGSLKLVRVDACIRYQGAKIYSLLMPGEFTSSFIAVRREE